MPDNVQIPVSELNPPVAQARGLKHGRFAELLQEITYRLPGCSDLEIRKMMQLVARDFCRRTGAWTEEIVLRPEFGRHEYPISAPAHSSILLVKRVTLFGFTVVPFGQTVALGKHPSYALVRRGDRDCYIQLYVPHCPNEFLPPNDYDTHAPNRAWPEIHWADAHFRAKDPFLRVIVSLVPGIATDEFPDTLLDTWGDAIVSGTIAKLCLQKGRAWSDDQTAAIEGKAYTEICATANTDRIKHGVAETVTTYSTIPFV